jgi:predicted acylesterase/phospholipase RssA
VPFCVTAVNLLNAEIIPIDAGPLYRGGRSSSSSYPGFFPPLKIENKILIDGGVLYAGSAKN